MPPLLERVLPPAEAVRPPASEPPMPKPLSADLSAVPSADLAATVRALVAETVAMVLGLPAAGDLDSQRPFNEQGLDSLMAADLAAALSQRLGSRLPGTLDSHFPPPAALSVHPIGRAP